jgi:hypothetical protein
MSTFKRAIATLAAVIVSGCGVVSSPADGLQFSAPAGWQASPGIMGFMQFWKPPGRQDEVLMLFKSPKPLKPSDVFSGNDLQGTVKNVSVKHSSSIRICVDQPAVLMQAEGTSSRGEDDLVDMVMTDAAATTYFALYVRPAASQSDPAALAALRELCAKK